MTVTRSSRDRENETVPSHLRRARPAAEPARDRPDSDAVGGRSGRSSAPRAPREAGAGSAGTTATSAAPTGGGSTGGRWFSGGGGDSGGAGWFSGFGASRWGARTVAVASHGRALVLALVAGGLAAVVSLLIIAVPVAVAWFADERSGASLPETAGVAMDLWALAHRGVIEASGVEIVFAPLLLTVIPLLLCRYAVGQVLVDRPGRGTGRISGAGAAWRALGGTELIAFTIGYFVTGLTWCYLAGLGQAPVQVGTAVPGLLLVPMVAIAMALWKEHRAGEYGSENPIIARALVWIEEHTPVLVRRGLRSAVESATVLLVGGVLIMMAMLVWHAERIGAVYGVLDTGVSGAVVLTLAQIAATPNLAVWGAGWAAGAPVQVGQTSIAWTESTAGDLPLIPIFAGFPESGPMPGWVWLAVLLPILSGAWVGWRAVQATPRLASLWTKAQIALSGCVGVALIFLVLSWLASGGLTPGRLDVVGLQVWLATGLVAGWVTAGALVSITVLHLTRRRVRRR